MKILICAAGSGGHIYPALSLAHRLRREDDAVKIVFLTAKRQIEKKIFQESDFETFEIDFIGLPKKDGSNLFYLCLKNLNFLLKFIKESIKVFKFLSKNKFDIVIGFGGAGSIGAVLGAKILAIPTLIHEQNLVPGRANRFLAGFSTAVATSFEESGKYFKRKNAVFTGNPIRSDLKKISKAQARKSLFLDERKFSILIFGGSQGSQFINEVFVQVMRGLNGAEKEQLQLIHVTGDRDLDKTALAYSNLNVIVKTFSYFLDMSLAYSAADLVVCRSGAATICELSYYGLPAVLIPYPYARQHQIVNANFMRDKQAAFVVLQDENCAQSLIRIIRNVLQNRLLLAQMADSACGLNKDNAAEKIAHKIKELVKSRYRQYQDKAFNC
ncbi:MAG: undecaprenyldiphospho-muramoylpentapeptide beta-N-acetylglucosaminyltransferase [Candidatus Omnitrophica bacterium]|nr:undecaprenyldiphospho-muramoylpentapeptide beta-N-acetylglucosaminyltransferase [Candidatus Omnitrophota bacterium]MBU1924656.1 undecaprenyldiphospho-muramoylpentapeptide beta-N-acetylglucosaminyltransferase [Candidatus Omnitrophota bacterium]